MKKENLVEEISLAEIESNALAQAQKSIADAIAIYEIQSMKRIYNITWSRVGDKRDISVKIESY